MANDNGAAAAPQGELIFGIYRSPRGISFAINPAIPPHLLLPFLLDAVEKAKAAAAQSACVELAGDAQRIQVASAIPVLRTH